MRRIRILHSAFAIIVFLVSIAAPIVVPVARRVRDIAMAPFQIVSAETFRFVVEQPALIAFRVIRRLKPEYRESYRTHGLNFHLAA